MSNGESKGSYKELRLGLVCYGGVSLAIYMHGLIKEIHKLLIASRAYETDPRGTNPFPAGTTERAYWDVLRAAEKRHDVRTRVVVDVVSGTSAGGINGVILAKAISQNRSQEPLTELWFSKGDINKLVGNTFFKIGKLLGIVGGAVLPKVKTKPPLRGNKMLGWLADAFREIDESERPTASIPGLESAATLVPDGQDLELFVTTTDFHGYTRNVVIADPPAVQEKRHRHIFRFRHGRRQFGSDYNGMLALAARATSSFPGAFPPVEFDHLDTVLGIPESRRERYETEFFREYQLAGQGLDHTYFVDGGVLDNKPFGHTLRAIAEKPAEVEVDRRLIYLEPDPTYEPPPAEAREPLMVKTAWGGLSPIASYEPILDDILAVDGHNNRVRRVNEIVDDCRSDVLELLDNVGAFRLDAPREQLAETRRKIQHRVPEMLGKTELAHHLLRVHSVIDQFAWGIAFLRNFPDESNANAWVRCVIRGWAQKEGLLGPSTDKPAQRTKQQELLDSFDLGYTRRRIQFVIQGVNHFYSREADPPRAELDAAKRALNHELSLVQNMIWGRSLPDGTEGALTQIFPRPRFDFQAETLDECAARFLEDDFRSEQLELLLNGLRQHLAKQRDEVRADLFKEFHALTANWPEEARKEVLMRYLGFPFWDALIYPIQALSEAGELDEIEVMRLSPEDSTALHPGGDLAKGRTAAKVKGIGKGHFAAFFKRSHRENDYLWGRLDAVERLVGLLLDEERPGPDEVKPAFLAVLEEEAKRPLGTIPETLRRLEKAAEDL